MVEAMILITESAYKELLHCQRKYFELLKNEPISEVNKSQNMHKEIRDKECGSDCNCQDQFGKGLEGASCECKDPNQSETQKNLIYEPVDSFKKSTEFFSELIGQNWFKRSPRKYRKVAETIFFSPGVMIGKDNVLHYQGARIHGSNIFDIVRNEANGCRTFYPGKIVIDRVLEKTNIQFKTKKEKKVIESTNIQLKRNEENEPWYEVL